MTETRTETFQLDDGRALRLTFAEPEQVVRGGLVVLHEARGMTDTARILVSALAAEGWLAVAPHLYHGVSGVDEVEHHDAADHVSKLSAESVLADADLAIRWLAARDVRSDLMGVIGFDIGGSVALAVAAWRSVGAAVTVAGPGIVHPLSDGLPSLVDIAPELRCPWLGLYGDRDEAIGVDEVEKLRDAAATSGVATTLQRFADADHRFDTDPEAASEAWQRALNWFDAHLR
ncbi:carboxymethylenebutenolidase [Herbihabitans rhizosphaerae]|uniref:Carboxymethylenebutenolidase n=1 Tax=Herbihabitans rhizosphaerae TaxID=1872711 RepID=A0A4Q7L6T4_9PSEU|nr:dienelactone hydrolase family protein [Herbihabitans rhizosphaerae]RZS45075.1 carboxymethylenebutenolidase [Herbihabitans rhizosphaerae]